MALGTAWCGRLTVTQEIQTGSIPVRVVGFSPDEGKLNVNRRELDSQYNRTNVTHTAKFYGADF